MSRLFGKERTLCVFIMITAVFLFPFSGFSKKENRFSLIAVFLSGNRGRVRKCFGLFCLWRFNRLAYITYQCLKHKPRIDFSFTEFFVFRFWSEPVLKNRLFRTAARAFAFGVGRVRSFIRREPEGIAAMINHAFFAARGQCDILFNVLNAIRSSPGGTLFWTARAVPSR